MRKVLGVAEESPRAALAALAEARCANHDNRLALGRYDRLALNLVLLAVPPFHFLFDLRV